MEKIAVYGTLKRWGFWHQLMVQAGAKYLHNDYIEFQSLHHAKSDDIWEEDRYYPHVIMWTWTWKFLFVEVYEIPMENMRKYIDELEEYTGGENDPYTRKICETLWGVQVWWYDSNWDAGDDEDNYFTHIQENSKYHNWTQ